MAQYPDFTKQILQLQALSYDAKDEQKQRLLNKWIEQLDEINEQIKHLEKIEKFAQKVSKD
ncbi:MAG: hypothetical protein CFH44_00908 [Proteobacteria bacterium]|jgi:hypothetical protein|nr:MAG: hypothetical protein CFH44_00908 [Pseudomonadota bacterium]|tara:strand:- start:155 stop:337 length:183 start_codon:yes stop_codon:yes gene_type:complete